MGNFFDIVITNNNSFYIVEPSSKPKPQDSAIETLKKIEFVVKNKLNYDCSHQDTYSKQSQYELFEILKDKSSEIHDRYNKKLFNLNLNWLLKIIFSKEEEITAIHKNIDNYIEPPQPFSLPDDMIQELAKHLAVPGLGALTEINRQGKTNGVNASVKKAQNLGYEGYNHAEAVKYIDDLFKEVVYLAQQRVIPEKYLCYKTKTFFQELNPEEILKNLQHLQTEDLFLVLSNEKLYSSRLKKVRKIFILKGNWEISKNDEAMIKQKRNHALFLSVKEGDKDLTDLLLKHGADPNIPTENGSYPLHYASQNGNADIVRLLLENKARVNEKGTGKGTALAFACGYYSTIGASHAKVVELLLQHGADPNIPTENGSYPLHYASQNGHADIVGLLLENKARVNEKGAGNGTALAFACGHYSTIGASHVKVVELLLQHGADPNISTENGSYPLHYASQNGHADIVGLLLENKARVNERGVDHATALAFACGYGDRTYHKPNVKVVELLLKHEADPNIPTQNVLMPLKLAEQNDFIEIISLLLDHNATL